MCHVLEAQHLHGIAFLVLHAEQDSQPTGGVGAWDEEDERQLWLLHLEQSAIAALNAQQVLQQELMLLQHALHSRSQDQQGQAAGASSSSSRGGTPQSPGAGQGPHAAATGDAAAKAAMAARLRDISQQLAVHDRQRAVQQVRRWLHSMLALMNPVAFHFIGWRA